MYTSDALPSSRVGGATLSFDASYIGAGVGSMLGEGSGVCTSGTFGFFSSIVGGTSLSSFSSSNEDWESSFAASSAESLIGFSGVTSSTALVAISISNLELSSLS